MLVVVFFMFFQFIFIFILKESYDYILKIIIFLNIGLALMLKKHIIFKILYIIVGPLSPASLKRFVFYKAPPSDKRSLL